MAQAGYPQRNTGRTGDDGRLNHDDKNKTGEPKTDPRNTQTSNPEPRPTHNYTPVRPIEGVVIAQPIDSPPVFIDRPDLPPIYDPNPPPTFYLSPATTPYSVVDYKSLGKAQFIAEDYFDAVESFQFALARDTSDYSLYYQLGITQIELGRYVDAIHCLSKFIKSVTYNGMGYYQRGLAKFYLGNKDKAFGDFLIADELNIEEVKLILKRFYNY